MNSWKIILATIVIFGTGVITGGLLVNHVDRGHFHRPGPGANAASKRGEFPPPSPEQRRLEFIRNISRRLNLTPKQREHIEAILHESQEHTRKIWLQIAPEMRAEMARVREKIRAELTPAQRQRFEELVRRPRRANGSSLRNRRARDANKALPPPVSTGPGASLSETNSDSSHR